MAQILADMLLPDLSGRDHPAGGQPRHRPGGITGKQGGNVAAVFGSHSICHIAC